MVEKFSPASPAKANNVQFGGDAEPDGDIPREPAEDLVGVERSRTATQQAGAKVLHTAENKVLKASSGAVQQSASSDEVSTLQDSEVEDTETSSPLEDIRTWSAKYTEDERDFRKFVKHYREHSPEDAAKYEKRLLSYERDIKFHWEMLEDETADAMRSGLQLDLFGRAEAQQIGTNIVEPAETIEAALGAFYDQRMQELSEQIRTSADGGASEDLALVGRTWARVNDYLRASQDIDLLQMDATAYHRSRTLCHNEMIRQLNAINQLAKKYHTTPLTPRNFMTNDFPYQGRRDKGGWLNSRAEYDRETVLQYFTTAFQKDFKRAADSIRRRSSQMF